MPKRKFQMPSPPPGLYLYNQYGGYQAPTTHGGGPTDDTIKMLEARFEQIKTADSEKHKLIEELIVRYKTLSEEHRRETADLDREREFNRSAQQKIKFLQDNLSKAELRLAREPFIMVLLDGDGMVFLEPLLQEGEIGGRRAANMLSNAVLNYAQRFLSEAAVNNIKVVARLYANFKGLSEALYKAGIVDRPSLVEEFFRGFTRGKALFDCIDVGAGKDRADDKLGETFKLYLHDYQCQQVIFGCSHDNGYVRLLEEVMMDTELQERITLLEGPRFEREYSNLPFKRTKFDEIFRNTKIQVPTHVNRTTSVVNTLQDPFNQKPLAAFSPPGLVSRMEMEPATQHGLSSSLGSSDGIGGTNGLGSWASTVGNTPAKALIPQSPPGNAQSEVPRNRAGQRLDPVSTRAYNKEEVQRLKKLKLCNIHFLRGDCPRTDGNCSHNHDFKPTKDDLQVLRLVARMAPCQYKGACDDPKCVYGHACAAPDSNDPKARAGGKTCIFGENCYFPAEMHGIDKTPVRRTKVT